MYAERLLVGVKPEQFARKAAGAKGLIDANHAAWCFGHLSLYPARAMTMLGKDAARLAPPGGFEDLFKDGTACRDDAEGTVYPRMDIITGAFFRGYDGLFEVLAGVDDAVLLTPCEEKVRARFPVLGARLDFVMGPHVQMHLGQVSAWRRAMGLPAA